MGAGVSRGALQLISCGAGAAVGQGRAAWEQHCAREREQGLGGPLGVRLSAGAPPISPVSVPRAGAPSLNLGLAWAVLGGQARRGQAGRPALSPCPFWMPAAGRWRVAGGAKAWAAPSWTPAQALPAAARLWSTHGKPGTVNMCASGCILEPRIKTTALQSRSSSAGSAAAGSSIYEGEGERHAQPSRTSPAHLQCRGPTCGTGPQRPGRGCTCMHACVQDQLVGSDPAVRQHRGLRHNPGGASSQTR